MIKTPKFKYLLNKDAIQFFLLSKRMPFNWKTPHEYLLAWLSQCSGGVAGVFVLAQFLNLVLGSCGLLIFIAEDITTKELAAFNTSKSDGNRAGSTKRFCGMVQIFSDAKQ